MVDNVTVNKGPLAEAIAACVSNGSKLVMDAECLGPYDGNPLVFVVLILAQEEFAKAFILHLIGKHAIPWNSSIRRALNNHASKHLVALMLEFLEPGHEAWMVEHEAWLVAHKEGRLLELGEELPPAVADAFDFFRYEHIGRWEKDFWGWGDGDPAYDAVAVERGEGRLEKAKQDALYVRIGVDGGVAKQPEAVDPKALDDQREITKRLEQFAVGLVDEDRFRSDRYLKLLEAFTALFHSKDDRHTA